MRVIILLNSAFCYEKDYEGDDKCDLCGGNPNDLFKNINCSETVCKSLGESCFSRLDEDECGKCSVARCNDFISEDQCYDGREIAKNACGEITARSSDTCSLGVCAWNASRTDGPKCFKDGDADGVPDSDQSDVWPPVTGWSKIAFIGEQGIDINFTFINNPYDYTKWFYYCINKKNESACCPSFSSPLFYYDKVKKLNPITSPNLRDFIDERGIYTLRFYAIDSHQNIEQTKNFSVYISPFKPVIAIEIVSQTPKIQTSDLELVIKADIDVKCDYELEDIESGSTNNYNNTHIVTFTDVPDGHYDFTADCADITGNRNIVKITVYPDAVPNIRNITPEYG